LKHLVLAIQLRELAILRHAVSLKVHPLPRLGVGGRRDKLDLLVGGAVRSRRGEDHGGGTDAAHVGGLEVAYYDDFAAAHFLDWDFTAQAGEDGACGGVGGVVGGWGGVS